MKASSPTPAQITRLYTLAGKAGLGRAGAKDEMFARYGVESSKELSARQYEDFTAFLEGMGRAKGRESKSRGVGESENSSQKLTNKLTSLADCEALLRKEWPEAYQRDPELAARLVEVVDCWRLWRLSGAMSTGRGAAAIQVLRRFDLRDVRTGVTAYLAGYTTKPERYVLAIVRNAERDRKQAERKSNRLEAEEKKQLAAAQHLAAEVVKSAGRPPVYPERSRGTATSCPFCAGKARVYYNRGDGVFTDVPCPWCAAGRQYLVEQITAGKRYDHRNWPAIREQLEERLARQAIADDLAPVGAHGDAPREDDDESEIDC